MRIWGLEFELVLVLWAALREGAGMRGARAGHSCGSRDRRRGAGKRLRAWQVRRGEAACGQKRERKGRRGAEVRLRARQVLLLSWCCLLLEVKKKRGVELLVQRRR